MGSTGITTNLAIGMLLGIIIVFPIANFFHIRNLKLYSGLLVVACGMLFALPNLIFLILNKESVYMRVNDWSGPLIIICYHLIYLNYIFYILRITKKREGR